MSCDYEKISKNWKKFLAEGLKEEYSFQDDVASMAVRDGKQLRRGEKPNTIRASTQNAAASVGTAKKLERLLPKVATNPITKSVLVQTIAAIKDQKVDLKSVLKLYEIVASTIKHGKSPDDALKTKGMFEKIFGDNVEIEFGVKKAFQRPKTTGEKKFGAKEKGPSNIALANLKFRFEESKLNNKK